MMRALATVAILVGAPAAARGERAMCRPGATYRGAPIDLDVKGADVHDVMRLLAEVGGVNIVVADSVQGKVTVKLKRVPWDAAACTIAAVHKLQVTVHGNVVLVTK